MTKLEQIARKLKKPTTIKQLTELTGWQPHSIRAALTQLRKKGHCIERTDSERGSRYQLKADT